MFCLLQTDAPARSLPRHPTLQVVPAPPEPKRLSAIWICKVRLMFDPGHDLRFPDHAAPAATIKQGSLEGRLSALPRETESEGEES